MEQSFFSEIYCESHDNILLVVEDEKTMYYDLGVSSNFENVSYCATVKDKTVSKFYQCDLTGFTSEFIKVVEDLLGKDENYLEVAYSTGVGLGYMAEYKPKHFATKPIVNYNNLSYLGIYNKDFSTGMYVFVKKDNLNDIVKLIENIFSIMTTYYKVEDELYMEDCTDTRVNIDLEDEPFDSMKIIVLDKLNSL